jgi:hypothetical protein
MARIDADYRKMDPSELVPKPARHRSRLEADAFRPRGMFAQQASQCTRLRLRLSFKDETPRVIDDAH